MKGFVWLCVFAILSGGLIFDDLTPKWAADLGVRVRPSYIDDELAAANDAGEVTAFRKLEVDVALFPLGARLPGVDRLVRGVQGMSLLSVVEVTPGRSRKMR